VTVVVAVLDALAFRLETVLVPTGVSAVVIALSVER
jgi:hypothetical protein